MVVNGSPISMALRPEVSILYSASNEFGMQEAQIILQDEGNRKKKYL